jgi:uncharacterized protein (UPF0332 family)
MQRDFLATALRLARASKNKPRQADLRRAVSTAYYAVFTCLAAACADCLVGKTTVKRSSTSWARVFRSLEHKAAKATLNRLASDPAQHSISRFSILLNALQEQRHSADYDPLSRIARSEAILAVDQATQAINDLDSLSDDQKHQLAVQLLFKDR